MDGASREEGVWVELRHSHKALGTRRNLTSLAL
jgi:hypothetical protein